MKAYPTLLLSNLSVAELLRAFPPFRKVDPRILHKLESIALRRDALAGESILEPGIISPGLLLIHAGELRVFRATAAGDEQVFRMAPAGSLIGFSGVTAEERSLVSIHAHSPSTFLALPMASLRGIAALDGAFAMLLLDHARIEAELMRELADDLSLLATRGRVIKWMLLTARKANPSSAETFDFSLRVPQSEIAAQLGTVREIVSRTFSYLQRQQILAISGRRIRVLSMSGLEREFAAYDAQR